MRIHQALTAGRESAWLYWQFTDGNPVSAYTLTDTSLGANSPKYVAAKHFFKYIRPNSVRVGATVTGSSNLLASAFLQETNQTLTLVLLNTSFTPIQTAIALPAQPAGITALRVFTSSNSNLWQTSTLVLTNLSGTVTVPGFGIATLYGVAPPRLHVTPLGQGSVRLSWSPAALGFQLQRASALAPENWQTDTNAVSTSGGVASVVESIPVTPGFYRLTLF